MTFRGNSSAVSAIFRNIPRRTFAICLFAQSDAVVSRKCTDVCSFSRPPHSRTCYATRKLRLVPPRSLALPGRMCSGNVTVSGTAKKWTVQANSRGVHLYLTAGALTSIVNSGRKIWYENFLRCLFHFCRPRSVTNVFWRSAPSPCRLLGGFSVALAFVASGI